MTIINDSGDIINDIIVSTLGCRLDDIRPDKHLCYDLLADSMALIDIMLNVETAFGFDFDEKSLSNIEYVRDLHQFVISKINCDQ